MDFLSSVRSLFATVDIFIAGMISKIYSLILQVADVNVINKNVEDIIERVYGIIGLFMLFKLVLVIINYVINPDKSQSATKLVTKVIVSLILIPTVPAIFDKAYQLQSIILNENIIGNIILGGAKPEGELSNIGDDVAYLVFSNFIDYNRDGILAPVFSGCPNIFITEDENTKFISSDYCCDEFLGCPQVPTCAYYLYFPTIFKDEYGMPDADGNYPDSRDFYYSCKSGDKLDVTIKDSWTMRCGIRDGKYIYDLIKQGRDNRSVSTILSKEIITAIEVDPFFYKGNNGNACSPKAALNADGDFVFSYNIPLSSIVGIIVTFLLIVICVDIAIRTIKLAFLQVISPIPIVSYVDVNSSRLFNSWLKETVTTFLQLFIRLAVIFFSILLFKQLIISSTSNSIIVNVFIIIGILLFMLQMPKLLCELFNLNKENGFLSLIKNIGKFAIGSTAIGISSVGGMAANAAATSENVKNLNSSISNASNNFKNLKTNLSNANGGLNKIKVVGSTIKGIGSVAGNIVKLPGSIIAGGISSSARTAKKLMDNKGNYKTGDITSSINESSMKRVARQKGISGMTQSDIKSEIKELETRQTNLESSYNQSQDYLSFNLASENNSSDIKKAFEQQHDNYTAYVSDMTASGNSSHIISEEQYNKYDELYSKQRSMNDEMEEINERLKLLNRYLKEK